MNSELEYCIEFADNFPQERKTALNFISCRFSQRAMTVATTADHFDAILKSHIAAHDILIATN